MGWVEHRGVRHLGGHGYALVEGRVLLLVRRGCRRRGIPVHLLRSVLEARLHEGAKVDGVGMSMVRVKLVGGETVLARGDGRFREVLSRDKGPRPSNASLGDEKGRGIR